MTTSHDSTGQDAPGQVALAEVPYLITLVPRDGAHGDLVSMGTRYWELRGLSADGRLFWAVKSRAIGADPGSQPHITALAGVVAEVPQVACVRCAAMPWQPASRAAFEALVRDGSPGSGCVLCDTNVGKAVAKILDPEPAGRGAPTADKRALKADEARRKALNAEGSRRVRSRWAQLCADEIKDCYPEEFTETPDWSTVRADIATEAATLACLRYAASTSPIPAIDAWPAVLFPDPPWGEKLIEAWWRSGLLAVHPSSSPESFVMDMTMEESAELGDRSSWDRMADTLTPPSVTGVYLQRVSWYSPHGPTKQIAAKWLDKHLVERLDPAAMDARRREELLTLISQLIAAETIRYFEFQLSLFRLPAVAANHRPRLEEAARLLSQHRCLGEGYHLAWLAARDAAAAAQTHSRAPREKMTVHGLNQFEQRVHQAVAAPEKELKVWHEDNRSPLSGLARLVFFGVLKTEPMTARPSAVAAALPQPLPDWPQLPDPIDDDYDDERPAASSDVEESGSPAAEGSPITEAVRELLNNMSLVDPASTIEAFRLIGTPPSGASSTAGLWDSPQRTAVEAMIRACQSVTDAGGDPVLGIVAACATATAFSMAYTDPEGQDTTVGEYLAAELVRCAFETKIES